MYYPSKLYSRISSSDKTKYIYNGNTLMATVRTVNGTVSPYYIHTDHLGSTTNVTDNTGIIKEQKDYYSYGNERISNGSCDLKRKYLGQYCDNDTALDYFNARYYNSYGGRFVSIDPVFWNPEKFLLDPQSLNAYSYARNNPVNLRDASGNMWSGSEWLQFAGSAVIGAGIAIGTAAVIGAVAVASPLVATVAVGALVVYGVAELGITTYESYEKNNGSIGGMARDLGSWASDNPAEVGGVVGGFVGCSFACKGATQLGGRATNAIEGFFSKKSTMGVIELNGPIGIPSKRLAHVFDEHTVGGKNTAGNSIFNQNEDVISLIKQGTQQPISPARGDKLQRIFDVGRNIGTDRYTNQQTSMMTIITNKAGNLITAYPGTP